MRKRDHHGRTWLMPLVNQIRRAGSAGASPSRLILLALAALALYQSSAAASYLWIDYHAGPATATSTSATVWSPEMWGWVNLNAIGTGVGAVNPLGGGQNAWRITDALATVPNPAYVTQLDSRAASEAIVNGWRYTTTARYVTDYGTGANMGLSSYFGGRAYHLMLDLTPAGALRATLYDETQRVYQLTGAGSDATSFHQFELQYAPGTAVVTFKFDGRTIDSQWNGIALPHENTFQWGNSNQSGANRGVMEFRDVTLAIGPFVPGDFNSDGVADGQDFLVWQRDLGAGWDRVADANGDGRVDANDLAPWRQSYGGSSAQQLGTPAPEPAAIVLVIAALAATFQKSRRKLA